MGKRIILVVEDDPVLRMLTCRQVAQLGYTCETVSSAEEALTRIQSNVGLIFMDIGLPGIDGITATILIRKKEVTESARRIPIVALTAHSKHRQCIEAGMDDFVQKPALLTDIKGVLDRWFPNSDHDL